MSQAAPKTALKPPAETPNMGGARAMRSSEAEGQLGRKDIEALTGQDVTNASQGMTYLESTLLTVPGILYTAETIMGALFQISMLPGIKNS